MVEDSTLKWSELKKLMQEADQRELIKLLHDLYENSIDNRRYITARFAKAEDKNKILEAYRKRIINVYFHPRGAASRPRYSVAKKAINDYYEASGDIKGTMDLMLTLNFTLTSEKGFRNYTEMRKIILTGLEAIYGITFLN